jgi:hypothetical protein
MIYDTYNSELGVTTSCAGSISRTLKIASIPRRVVDDGLDAAIAQTDVDGPVLQIFV